MDLSPETLLHWISTLPDDPLLILAAIAVLSLIVDSAALIVAAILVGNGTLGSFETIAVLSVALLAGDMAIYLFGRLAREHPRLEAWLNRDQLEHMATWLEERQIAVLVLSRFLPGSRSITYLACGFFQLSATRFALITGITGLVWTIVTIAFIGSLGHFFKEYGLAINVGIGLLGAIGLMVPAHLFAQRSKHAPARKTKKTAEKIRL